MLSSHVKDHRCYGYIINPALRSTKKFTWYFIGVYIINRILHGRLEIRRFSSSVAILTVSSVSVIDWHIEQIKRPELFENEVLQQNLFRQLGAILMKKFVERSRDWIFSVAKPILCFANDIFGTETGRGGGLCLQIFVWGARAPCPPAPPPMVGRSLLFSYAICLIVVYTIKTICRVLEAVSMFSFHTNYHKWSLLNGRNN